MNLPTKLTVLRLIMIPLFAAAFFIEALPARFIISAAIFALAAFTDYDIRRRHVFAIKSSV